MKTLAPLLISCLWLAGAGPAPAPAEVTMKSLGYAPKVVEITAGQAVIWKNTSYTEHSALADGGAAPFDTGMVAPGTKSKPITFATPGEFPYHCGLHGKTMSGVVKVSAAAP